MNPEDRLEWAALVALDALEESERLQLVGTIENDGELAGAISHFHRVLEALALGASESAPVDLMEPLMAGATAQRPPGRPTGPWAVTEISPVECTRRAAARLIALLRDLRAEEWLVPCPPYEPWRVRDLAAHLVAVESQLAQELGLPNAGPALPGASGDRAHHRFTLPLVAELAEGPVDEVRDRLIAALDRVTAAVAATDEEQLRSGRVNLVGAPQMPVATALIVRTFELWTHTEDICRAVGRPLVTVDPDQLRLLCDLAVEIIPLGAALMGMRGRDACVRVVLSGPGGGAWTSVLGAGSASTGTLIVADALQFCRVAAQRLTPAQLEASVSGDRSLAEEVLRAVAIFAA